MISDKIKVIAFDADDTLWVNEPSFQDVEKKVCTMLQEYGTPQEISQELFHTEMQNINIYGYGAKSFTLSLVETALRVSNNSINSVNIKDIVTMGKSLLQIPIQLLDGVQSLLSLLYGHYEIIVATKGDLLDQQRKLKRSKLEKYFNHVEIMSDKTENDYTTLLSKLKIKPDEFMMIGNSLKSDILPVLNIGGYGAYIPYGVTWKHEKSDKKVSDKKLIQAESLSHLMKEFDI
jgi:putative hydrolase of the HAD superfamily